MMHGSQHKTQTMQDDEAQRIIKALQKDVETFRKEKTAAEMKITSLTAGLNSMSERYKEGVRQAREAIAKKESQNNSFRENNMRLEEAWKNAHGRYERMASRFNDVSQQLAAEKHNSAQKLAQLHHQNKILEDKIRILQDKNTNLHDKNDTLRQMVVPVSEKQVLDADVMQKFTALRASIVGLVRQTWIPELKDDCDSLGLSLLQGDLITTDLPLTYDRLRYMVFFFIHASVFDTQSYFLGHPFENVEQLFRRVEKELNNFSPRGRSTTCSRITLSSYVHVLT